MSGILTEIVSLLTGAITAMGDAIGSGLSSIAKAVFITETTSGGTTTQSLSVFGSLIVIFAGIALACGLVRLVAHWLGTLGGSKI